MDLVATFVSAVNLAICGWRFWRSLMAGRLVALVWALVTYHSIFLVQLCLAGPFSKHRGFTNDYISVGSESISVLAWYALVFNVIFAASEAVIWRLSSRKHATNLQWNLDRIPSWLTAAQWIYLGFLLIGGIWYWFKMAGGGYQTYVEYRQSNWPQVFFWASAPLITVLALRRQWTLAMAACLPFLFFALYLHIRAFALLSLVPAAVVLYFQTVGLSIARRRQFVRPVVIGAAIFTVLVAVSIIVTYKKTADIEGFSSAPGEITGLPDAGMVYGAAIVFEYVRDHKISLGSDALIQYGWNIINPFMRLFGQRPPVITDPPIYIAYIVDGVPPNSSEFFHYPALWYSDAFLTYGLGGVLLAALWACILALWERLMTRNLIVLALLLPYYTWHAYMLVRGTPTSATVPLAYAAYIALIVMLLVAQFRFLQRSRANWRKSLSKATHSRSL